MKKLKKKELKEINGGYISLPGDNPIEEFIDAKRNVNRTSTCACNYEDFSAIKNINKVSGCVCNCV